MATRVKGHEIGLYYSPTNDPFDWKLIACLTDKSFNGTKSTIEINSDCEGGDTIYLPGNKSWSFDMTGHYITDPTAEQVSSTTLFDLWNENVTEDAVGWFKMDDGAGYVRVGKGFVSSFSETMTSNDFVGFTATISNAGVVESVEAS